MKRIIFFFLLLITAANAQYYLVSDSVFTRPKGSTVIFNSPDSQFTFNGYLSYNMVHIAQSFTSKACTLLITQNVYVDVTNITNNLSTVYEQTRGIAIGDSIKILYSGDYYIPYSLSYDIITVGTARVRLVKNGNEIPGPQRQFVTTGQNSGSVSGYFYGSVLANDVIKMQVTNTQNNNDIIVTDGSLGLFLWY